MSSYYSISFRGNENFGVACAPEGTPLIFLSKEGRVESWQKMRLTLRGDGFADYMANNLGFRLCSKKLKTIFEKCQSEKDMLQWLEVEVVVADQESRPYYILHFPVVNEVLDKKRTFFSKRGILLKPVINIKIARDHEIFTYRGGGQTTLIISENVRSKVKGAACTGLAYTRIFHRHKRCLPKHVRRVLRGFVSSHRTASVKKRLAKSISSLSEDFERPELRLPIDLVTFLRKGMELEYDIEMCEAGHVELIALERLSLDRVYINSFESPLRENDPHAGKDGYYIVPTIDLIAECDGYDSRGILVWLPEEKLFGTWDSDHYDLRVFPRATWMDIVSDPVKYINAQWHPERITNEFFVPWPKYPFTKRES